MAATRVVNILHEPFDIYIGRRSHHTLVRGRKFSKGLLGNPFRLGRDTMAERERVLGLYREHFLALLNLDSEFKSVILACRGLILGCWCKPKLCHGDVIVEWLNARA